MECQFEDFDHPTSTVHPLGRPSLGEWFSAFGSCHPTHSHTLFGRFVLCDSASLFFMLCRHCVLPSVMKRVFDLLAAPSAETELRVTATSVFSENF